MTMTERYNVQDCASVPCEKDGISEGRRISNFRLIHSSVSIIRLHKSSRKELSCVKARKRRLKGQFERRNINEVRFVRVERFVLLDIRSIERKNEN